MAHNGKLTERRRRFVEEYMIDGNATQAAIRAGYSAKTAEQQGPRLLGNVGVREEIAKRREQRSAVTNVKADEALLFWARVMRGEIDISEVPLEHRLRASEYVARHLGMFIERRETVTKPDWDVPTLEARIREIDAELSQIERGGDGSTN